MPGETLRMPLFLFCSILMFVIFKRFCVRMYPPIRGQRKCFYSGYNYCDMPRCRTPGAFTSVENYLVHLPLPLARESRTAACLHTAPRSTALPTTRLRLLNQSPLCDLLKFVRDLSYSSVTYSVLPTPYGSDAVHSTNPRSIRCAACWSGPPAMVALDLHPDCTATLRPAQRCSLTLIDHPLYFAI
jgi:hypothetical protein